MKRRRFALDIRPAQSPCLPGCIFCCRCAGAYVWRSPWWCMSWAMLRCWCCAARRSTAYAWRPAGWRCAARRRRARCARSRRRWAGPAAGAGLFCILRGLGYPEGADLSLLYACANLLPVLPLDGGRALEAVVAALAGARAAERLLDVLGLVLPVALMGFGVVLFARGMGLALGVFGAWLALLQPGMTCQGGKHDVKYSYYHM